MSYFDAKRFLDAQAYSYDIALQEIRRGRKSSHWVWYIFPQLLGLGHSPNANLYGIRDLEEAKAYLQHPTLRARLIEITEALLGLNESIYGILGSPDHLKVRSCMTLFREAAPEIPVFQQVIDKFYDGYPDPKTLSMLQSSGESRRTVFSAG